MHLLSYRFAGGLPRGVRFSICNCETPRHHAESNKATRFCLYNNVDIAEEFLLKFKVFIYEKLLYVVVIYFGENLLLNSLFYCRKLTRSWSSIETTIMVRDGARKFYWRGQPKKKIWFFRIFLLKKIIFVVF